MKARKWCLCQRLSTWPAECIVRLCLPSGSRTATASPPDWIRCNQSPRAGRPCWLLSPWLPPPDVCRQRSWPLCPGWLSPDTPQPPGEVKLTSCTEKRLLLWTEAACQAKNSDQPWFIINCTSYSVIHLLHNTVQLCTHGDITIIYLLYNYCSLCHWFLAGRYKNNLCFC